MSIICLTRKAAKQVTDRCKTSAEVQSDLKKLERDSTPERKGRKMHAVTEGDYGSGTPGKARKTGVAAPITLIGFAREFRCQVLKT